MISLGDISTPIYNAIWDAYNAIWNKLDPLLDPADEAYKLEPVEAPTDEILWLALKQKEKLLGHVEVSWNLQVYFHPENNNVAGPT